MEGSVLGRFGIWKAKRTQMRTRINLDAKVGMLLWAMIPIASMRTLADHTSAIFCSLSSTQILTGPSREIPIPPAPANSTMNALRSSLQRRAIAASRRLASTAAPTKPFVPVRLTPCKMLHQLITISPLILIDIRLCSSTTEYLQGKFQEGLSQRSVHIPHPDYHGISPDIHGWRGVSEPRLLQGSSYPAREQTRDSPIVGRRTQGHND
jgi:hypothetical protein